MKLCRHVIIIAAAGPREQKMCMGIRGCFANLASYQMKIPNAATPMTRGAIALADAQSLSAPAPVWRPKRKATVPPMIRTTPVQSSARRLSKRRAVGMSASSVHINTARAAALIGRLIQTNIDCQQMLVRIKGNSRDARLTTPPPPDRLCENTSQNRSKTTCRSEDQAHQTVVLRPVLHFEHPANQNRDQDLDASTRKTLDSAAANEHFG